MTLPAGWQLLPLGAVAEINPRRPTSLSSLPGNTPVTFVPMAAVDEFSGAIEAPEVRPLAEVRSGFTWFGENDVIFAKITPCMQNGKSAVARGLQGGFGFGSTEFHVLRAGDRVLPDWIWYFVREASFREEAKQNFKGTAGQQRVPTDWLAGKKIPLPPLEEQRRLVVRIREAISRVDEVRGLRTESITESKGLLPSLLKEVFVEVAARSERVTIGGLATESRYGTSERCTSENPGTPVLRIPNVAGGHVNFSDLKFLPGVVPPNDPLALREGDLLLVRTNGSPDMVGRCAVVPQLDRTFAYASYLIRVRLDALRVDSKYVSYFLASTLGRDQIATKRHTSAGQYNINTQDIKSFEIPLPPLARQRVLVQRMSEVEKTVQTTGAELSDAQARDTMLPSAILRKAFAGEL